MESEIARIRLQIDEECRALKLAMEGFAAGASHKAITARYERLGVCHQELTGLVGSQADALLYEAYHRIID